MLLPKLQIVLLLLVLFAPTFPPTTRVSAATLSADDWFHALDSNHDNVLDRDEYDTGVAKLRGFLHQPLSSPSASGEAGAGDASSSLSLSRMAAFVSSSGIMSVQGFWSAFTSSVAMILATEIGDKTFFIAAVLSMQHDRVAVLLGALAALYVMTVLSCLMGVLLPSLLPREYTHILGGLLFLYFGCKLYWESRKLQEGKTSDELEEVEEELLHQKKDEEVGDEEAGTSGSNNYDASGKGRKRGSGSNNSGQGWKKQWYQVAIQSFTLTFLAEWGDRSQIATIALGAHKNPLGVTVGGCLGHTLCTGLAVVGGRMLAARISEKTVHQWGGIIFLIFGFHSLFFEQ
jgi:Ca2+/H+ antiporter, TMEM165/GDT1 family